jgi:hypothetical protein
METHANHLHKAPGKNFWHFFFEFFMLFLAVFCGLLAENWREQFVDRKHEKEYMKSMIEDLQSDTSVIQAQVDLGTEENIRGDSILDLLNSENPASHVFDIYRLNLSRLVLTQLEDRTSSQLKNAGGMRLIRNDKVVEALRNYWNTTKALEKIETRMDEYASKAQTIGSQIFNNKYYIYNDKKIGFFAGITIDPAAKFVNADPKLLSQFSNTRYVNNLILKNYVLILKSDKEAAIELMEIIRERYPGEEM